MKLIALPHLFNLRHPAHRVIAFIATVLMLAGVLQATEAVSSNSAAHAADTTLAITQTLTSDRINTSSTAWPVGVRACVSGLAAGQSYAGVSSTFKWTTSGVGIDLIGSPNQNFDSLTSTNNCVDIYYQISISGNDPGTVLPGTALQSITRKYVVTVDLSKPSFSSPAASAPTPTTLSSTSSANRQIWVTSAINSNNQTVNDLTLDGSTGTTPTVTVGETYTFNLSSKTGTNSQISSVNAAFDPRIFQIISATSVYTGTKAADNATTNGFIRNACAYDFEAVSGSTTYNTCTGSSDFSADVIVRYRVKVIAQGSQSTIVTTVASLYSGAGWKTTFKNSTGVTGIQAVWPLNLTVNNGSANAYVSSSASPTKVSGTDTTAACASWPCTVSASYSDATKVTLTANTTEAGKAFAGWGGACSGTATTCVVTMDSVQNVSASFGSVYPLSVNFAGAGTGSVTSSPSAISCSVNSTGATSGVCSTVYNSNLNQSVTLTATANAGQVFIGWSGGGCTGTGTCTVVMSSGKTVTAEFAVNPNLSVKIGSNDAGPYLVSANSGGISCTGTGSPNVNATSGTCNATYSINQAVTLTAPVKTAGARPIWIVSPASAKSSGCADGTATCALVMTVDTVVTVSYAGMPLSVSVDTYVPATNTGSTGTGSVASSDSTIKCGDGFTACSYLYGTSPLTTTLTATAKSGSAFGAWEITGVSAASVTQSADCAGATGVCTLTWTAATTSITVVAKFNASVSLTVNKSSAAAGTVTNVGSTISCNTTCATATKNYAVSPYASETLTATPASGYYFIGWSGSGCSGTGTCAVTVNDNLTVLAQFGVAKTITVNVVGGNGTVTPGTSAVIPLNSTPTYTITPSAGYHIATATLDGTTVMSSLVTTTGEEKTYTFVAVTADHTLQVTFSNTYTITVSSGANGTVSPTTSSTVTGGSTPTYTITPSTGYHVATATVDGVSVMSDLATVIGATRTYTFASIAANHTLAVTYTIDTFTITSSAGVNGSITASLGANYNETKTFTITPNAGYRIATLAVDGNSTTVASTFTFSNIQANHTISVTFVQNNYSATLNAASAVTSTSATLSGSINPNGDTPSAVSICWKVNGSASPCTSVNLLASVTNNSASNALSTSLSGLTAGQTYSYVLSYTDSSGFVTTTTAQTFTTAAAVTKDVVAATIGVNTATIGSTFTSGSSSLASGDVTSVNLCYKASAVAITDLGASPTCINNWTASSSLAASTPMDSSQPLVGLDAGTTYYFQVQVTFATGQVVNGAVKSFNTLGLPQASVDAPISISSAKATIRGTINPKNNSLNKVTFCWKKAASISLADCTAKTTGESDADEDLTAVSAWNGSASSHQFTRQLSNLDAGSTYSYLIYTNTSNFRASGFKPAVFRTAYIKPTAAGATTTAPSLFKIAATTSSTVVSASTGQFTTASASTDAADAVSSTAARLNGTLNTPTGGLASGDVSSVKLCYATTNATAASGAMSDAALNCGTSLWAGTTLAGAVAQKYHRDLTGLNAVTQYFFQIQVVFTDGSAIYGSVLDFTTLTSVAKPSVALSTTTSITTTTATLNGLVNANNDAITSASFCWWGNGVLEANCTPVTLTTTGWSTSAGVDVSTNLTGLAPGTTYYFKLTATNNTGTTTTTAGSFTTKVSVSYVNHSGTGPAPAIAAPTDTAGPYDTGSTVTVLGNTTSMVVDGYYFAGWSLNADGTGTLYSPDLTAKTYTVPAAPTGNITFYAVWTAYTVTYSTGTGTGTEPTSSSGPVTLPTTQGAMIAPAHTTFGGWTCTPGSTAGGVFTPTATATCTAIWIAATSYTVTYNKSGSETGTVPTNSTAYYTGDSVTVAGNTGSLTLAGNAFSGWYISGAESTLYGPAPLTDTTYTIATSNVSFLAKWTAFTVIYNTGTGGGTEPTSGSGVINSLPDGTGMTAPTGNTFAGWVCTPGTPTGTLAAGSSFTPTGDAICTAQWTAHKIVTFDKNGGAGSMSNQLASTPTNLTANTYTKAGAYFSKWLKQSSSPAVYLNDQDSYNFAADITLLAQWVNYTVTFNAGTNGTNPPTALDGVITLPAQGTMSNSTGATFTGWQCTPGSPSGTLSPGATFTPTGNATCIAQWGAAATTFTVFYSATQKNSGTLPTNTVGSGNVTLRFNTGNLARTGYTFAGWIIQGVNYNEGDTFNLTVDVTAEARWNSNAPAGPTVYTINFIYMGGSGTVTSMNYTAGTTGVTLPTTSRAGYSFKGWGYTSNSSSFVSSPFAPVSDVTLWANWQGNTVTITFNYNGGSEGIKQTTYTVGDPGIKLPDSSKDKYNLQGWTTDPGNPKALVDDPFSPLTSTSLTAVWKGEIYNVTLVSPFDAPAIELKYEYGTKGLMLPVLTMPGWAFLGWSPDKIADQGVDQPYTPTKTETLWSVWKNLPAVSSVYFDGDSPVLRADTKAKLKLLAKKVLKVAQRPTMIIDGWVKETTDKSYDQKLSLQRAINTANYLRKLGINAIVNTTPKGIDPSGKDTARRTDVSLFLSGPNVNKYKATFKPITIQSLVKYLPIIKG